MTVLIRAGRKGEGDRVRQSCILILENFVLFLVRVYLQDNSASYILAVQCLLLAHTAHRVSGWKVARSSTRENKIINLKACQPIVKQSILLGKDEECETYFHLLKFDQCLKE